MCEGAFSSPSSMCCQPQSSPTIRSSARLEVARDERVGVLVDRDAGRRVRHVDEHRRAARAPRPPRAPRSVMSSSCVSPLGGDAQLAHGGRILRTDVGRRPAPSRELDAFRDQRRPLHRRARRGVLPPLRRAQGDARRRAGLRAPRGADAARDRTAACEGAPTELWRFACEGFLGNLTREHQARRRAVEAELEATVDGETIPYRMLRVGDVERARPRQAAAARGGARAPARRAPEPGLPRGARRSTATPSCELGAPNYYELYKRFGFRLDELAARVPRAARRDREAAGRREGDRALPRAARHRRSPTRGPWDVARLFRAPELDKLYPIGPRCCPRSRRRSPTSASTCARRRTSTSTSTSRPNKSPRAFCAPIEVPGRVMLVIQPIGGKDDWEALFHEAGHTEHYANTSGRPPDGGKRLGDMAVTEGWATLMQHLVTEPAWLNRRLDVPRSRSSRTTARCRSSTSSAATRPSCSTRSSSSRPTTCTHDAQPLRRAAERRAEAAGQPGELPRRHRRQLLRHRATCARGRSRRSCASSCAASSATTGSRGARPAICCASSGRSARGRRPTSC